MPIGKGFVAIQKAVVECAMAGCNTIWIICNDDIAPVIRYRVGDYIQDPIHFYNNYGYNPSDRRVRIPIFWVPIHPKDRDKRDCLSWSVIHGAITSLKISTNISKWLIPDKYYVSFPYGIFDPRPIQKLRKKIKSKNNFYVRSENKTIKDNYYCSFTFGKDEFIKYRKNVRKGTGMYSSDIKSSAGIPISKLPIEERWSARFFEPYQVFSGSYGDDDFFYDVENYFNMNTWDGYKKYIRSEFSDIMKRPTRELFSYREFNRIGADVE